MRSLFLQRGFATGPAMGSRGKAVLDMIKNADTTTLIRGVESLPVEGAVTFLELLKKGLTTAEVRPNLARSLLRSNRRDTPVVRLNLRTDQCFEYGRDREVQLILRMLATTVEMVQWGIPDQTISERTGDACFWRRLVEIVRPDVAVTLYGHESIAYNTRC
ncbi:hypothetical protein BC832DRAFT_401934 [Gaertneriomyces semiglobifer]|nr:hypothetical protein BC832DRAFT_401934 [Gaertneriomyces semiglobifer]